MTGTCAVTLRDCKVRHVGPVESFSSPQVGSADEVRSCCSSLDHMIESDNPQEPEPRSAVSSGAAPSLDNDPDQQVKPEPITEFQRKRWLSA
jgi:hypothetical protein